MLYNVYCDETCHLEHDGINDMVIGAVWCPQDKLREINQRIQKIKIRNKGNEPHCYRIRKHGRDIFYKEDFRICQNQKKALHRC